MAGPWENYQQQDGPWSKYAAPVAMDAPDEPFPVKLGKQVIGVAAGLGSGVGRVAMGAQEMAGRGLSAVGMDRAGGWLQKDAVAGRQKLKGEVAPYKEATPFSAGLGEISGEVLATLPVGGAIAGGLSKLPGVAAAMPNLLNAIRTGGMVAGQGGHALAQLGTRAAGGAITGGASAALVDPDSAGTGAMIGGALPGATKLAGIAGRGIRGAVTAGGGPQGKSLAEAFGVTEQELPAIIAALKNAPDSIVPGSKLTVSQALAQQGMKMPHVSLLERTVSGGPGGDALLRRYSEQGGARMAALEAQGAQTYQGAAREEAEMAGSKIGAILRTQARDDRLATKALWDKTYSKAADEQVAIRLPLDQMNSVMAPLGRGTVGAGKDARALMAEAQNIGTVAIPAVKTGKVAQDTTLIEAVKRAGGINLSSQSSQMLAGEIQGLKGDKLGRVFYKDKGKSVARMAESMHEAGFIDEPDPVKLLEALRGGGRTVSGAVDQDAYFRAQAAAAMGDAPEAQRLPVALPFAEFQRLRRSANELSASPNMKPAEAQVLGDIRDLLTKRVDDLAGGSGAGDEYLSPGFRNVYNQARDATRLNAERYKSGNAITQILRNPMGQGFTLGGDEITGKLWHGGLGLSDDVNAFRGVLSDTNREPALNSLRQYVMTDAASRTTAGGNLGAGLPRYVEQRMPGLLGLMNPDQTKALTSVAADIRNANNAAAVPGLLGSDTQAKLSRALDAGLLDSTVARAAANLLSVKGLGGETIRRKAAESFIEHKGRRFAGLLADPAAAAAALQDRAFVSKLTREVGPDSVGLLGLSVARALPVAIPSVQQ